MLFVYYILHCITHVINFDQDGNKLPGLLFTQVNSENVRDNLERIVGTDDSAFNGLDLATLIRNKYGKSYDVQLIKKVC